MEKHPGSYLGTEINQSWWRRYKDNGFFARGAGEYWFDQTGFCFQLLLTRTQLCIPYEQIVQIRRDTWHAGTWRLGRPIVKVIWERGDMLLSSGFIVGRDEESTQPFVDELAGRLQRARF